MFEPDFPCWIPRRTYIHRHRLAGEPIQTVAVAAFGPDVPGSAAGRAGSRLRAVERLHDPDTFNSRLCHPAATVDAGRWSREAGWLN
jgi:hypothetical protein